MVRRNKYAVAIAHGFDPLICLLFNNLVRISVSKLLRLRGRLTHDIKYSIDLSTGSLETDLMKVENPGISDTAEGAIVEKVVQNSFLVSVHFIDVKFSMGCLISSDGRVVNITNAYKTM